MGKDAVRQYNPDSSRALNSNRRGSILTPSVFFAMPQVMTLLTQ